MTFTSISCELQTTETCELQNTETSNCRIRYTSEAIRPQNVASSRVLGAFVVFMTRWDYMSCPYTGVYNLNNGLTKPKNKA